MTFNSLRVYHPGINHGAAGAALPVTQSVAAGWFNRRNDGNAGTSDLFADRFANGSFGIGRRYPPAMRRQACS